MNFTKFIGKKISSTLFLNSVLRLLPKERLLHRCFSVGFAKFLRTPFFTKTPLHACFCLFQIEQVICPKCCWKSETVAQLPSVKMGFCKTLQISQEIFRKSVNPQDCNCTKKDAVCGVFLWMYLCEYVFSLFYFSPAFACFNLVSIFV